MSDSSAALAAKLGARIDAGRLESEPFDHVYLEDVFPPEVYRALLDSLPATGIYSELQHPDAMRPDGSSARRKLPLYLEHLLFLPPAQRAFWRHLSRVLRSRDVQVAFKRKFRAALERRFGRGIDALWFRPNIMLVRDLEGYRIGIHADVLRKAITVQFYLPRDGAQAHLGTHFHDGRDGEAAQRVKAMPFRPNSAYAFPVSRDESWHSVPPTVAADGERNTLMMTYYVRDRFADRLASLRSRVMEFARRIAGR